MRGTKKIARHLFLAEISLSLALFALIFFQTAECANFTQGLSNTITTSGVHGPIYINSNTHDLHDNSANPSKTTTGDSSDFLVILILLMMIPPVVIIIYKFLQQQRLFSPHPASQRSTIQSSGKKTNSNCMRCGHPGVIYSAETIFEHVSPDSLVRCSNAVQSCSAVFCLKCAHEAGGKGYQFLCPNCGRFQWINNDNQIIGEHTGRILNDPRGWSW